MTDEERLQAITEQLIIVRDNLTHGMSKSMQKLQARAINEVLGLPNFTTSPQLKPLTDAQIETLWHEDTSCDMPDELKQFRHTAKAIEAAHGIK
jgi:hypothetical protein